MLAKEGGDTGGYRLDFGVWVSLVHFTVPLRFELPRHPATDIRKRTIDRHAKRGSKQNYERAIYGDDLEDQAI